MQEEPQSWRSVTQGYMWGLKDTVPPEPGLGAVEAQQALGRLPAAPSSH